MLLHCVNISPFTKKHLTQRFRGLSCHNHEQQQEEKFMKFSIHTDLWGGHSEQPCLVPPHQTPSVMSDLSSCSAVLSVWGNHPMFQLEMCCKAAAELCWWLHEIWCHVDWWPVIIYLSFHFWQLCSQVIPKGEKNHQIHCLLQVFYSVLPAKKIKFNQWREHEIYSWK